MPELVLLRKYAGQINFNGVTIGQYLWIKGGAYNPTTKTWAIGQEINVSAPANAAAMVSNAEHADWLSSGDLNGFNNAFMVLNAVKTTHSAAINFSDATPIKIISRAAYGYGGLYMAPASLTVGAGVCGPWMHGLAQSQRGEWYGAGATSGTFRDGMGLNAVARTEVSFTEQGSTARLVDGIGFIRRILSTIRIGTETAAVATDEIFDVTIEFIGKK